MIWWNMQQLMSTRQQQMQDNEKEETNYKRLRSGKIRTTTDPPRFLEPGNLGCKVRRLAHVQGYMGPKGKLHGAKKQVPVPNLSTHPRLHFFDFVPGCLFWGVVLKTLKHTTASALRRLVWFGQVEGGRQ